MVLPREAVALVALSAAALPGSGLGTAGFVAVHLAAFAIAAAGIAALGRTLWPKSGHDALERLIVSCVLGYGALATTFALLAAVHALRAVPTGAALAALTLLGIPGARETGRDLRTCWREIRKPWLLAGFTIAVPLALLALYPPTAFDATLYHLPFAQRMVRTGGLGVAPESRYPAFPELGESLFAGLLLVDDDLGAQLTQVLATGITAGLALLWGRRSGSALAGPLAAAVWLGNPIVVALAPTAYVEPSLALFATAAAYGARRWRDAESSADLVFAAVCAGWAASVKYLGLVVAAGIVVAWISVFPRRAGAAFRMLSIAALTAAPWYVWIALATGDPVYPYFGSLFGVQGSPNFGGAGSTGTWARRLLDLVRWPWDVSFARERTGSFPPVSPIYLPVAVAGAALGGASAEFRGLALLAGVWVVPLLVLTRDARLLSFALPIASVAVAVAVAGVWARWRADRRWLAAAIVAVLLPGWLYAIRSIARAGPLPVSAAEREEFLDRREPGYAAIAFLNRSRGRAYSVYAIGAEQLAYFADGRFLGDWFGPARFELALRERTAAGLHSWLAGLAVDHLLVRGAAPPAAADPDFSRYFERIFAYGDVVLYRLAPIRTSGTS